MLPEIGKNGSLAAMRNYLQKECNMLQVWAGKTVDDDDYITFVCEDMEHYAVLQSPTNSREYTVIVSGDIVYLHEKNLDKLAGIARDNQ